MPSPKPQTYPASKIAVGRPLPRGIYTTIRAAILCEISFAKDYIEESKADEDEKELAMAEAQYAALKRRLATLKSSASKKDPKATS